MPDHTQNSTQENLRLQAALAHHQAGRLQAAQDIYETLLRHNPEHAEALHHLGLVALQRGRLQDAVTLISRASSLRPDEPTVWGNLGVALNSAGKPQQATACLRKAVSLKPDYAQAYSSLALALRALDRLEEAEACARQAVRLTPEEPDALNNLGLILRELGHQQEAESTLRKATELAPEHASAFNNLGLILQDAGRLEDAERVMRLSISLQPDTADFHNNLALLLQDMGRWKESADSARRAIGLAVQHAGAKTNLALALLSSGDYETGLPLYEQRFGVRENRLTLPPAIAAAVRERPAWQGEDVAGKTLLILCDQGHGDNLMMMRYLPLLAKQGAVRIKVVCNPALARIFAALRAPCEAIPWHKTATPGQFDLHCPMMSLPQRFGTRIGSIPNAVPYVHPNDADILAWRARTDSLQGLKVGIAWAGNPTLRTDARRSVPPEALQPLLQVEGVCFISLQKNALHRGMPGSGMHNWMDECRDFYDTACLVSSLDLVISADTAVAHLAGALGRPVWMLNRYESEWRWMLEREDSPWYPTMRVLRQPDSGNWAGLCKRATEELMALI